MLAALPSKVGFGWDGAGGTCPWHPAQVSGCPQQRLSPFVSYKPLEKLLEEVWVLRLSLQRGESILFFLFSTFCPFMWSLSLEAVPQAC